MHRALVGRYPAVVSVMKEKRVADLPLPQRGVQVKTEDAVVHKNSLVVDHLAVQPCERRIHVGPKEKAVHVPAVAQPSAGHGDRNGDDSRPSDAAKSASLPMHPPYDLEGSSSSQRRQEE